MKTSRDRDRAINANTRSLSLSQKHKHTHSRTLHTRRWTRAYVWSIQSLYTFYLLVLFIEWYMLLFFILVTKNDVTVCMSCLFFSVCASVGIVHANTAHSEHRAYTCKGNKRSQLVFFGGIYEAIFANTNTHTHNIYYFSLMKIKYTNEIMIRNDVRYYTIAVNVDG